MRPVISDPIWGYKRVNVEAQRRDPESFLNWVERKIRMRKECPEISWGNWEIVDVRAPQVLAMTYEWQEHSLLILHNFSDKPQASTLDARTAGTRTLTDLLWTNDSIADREGRDRIELEAYGYRWFRAGGVDRNVPRS